MAKLFRKYFKNRNWLELITNEDLPEPHNRGLCAQFTGNYPIGVAVGVSVPIAHLNSRIIQPDLLTVVSLNPAFEVRPRKQGFYIVHHKRQDFIYPAGSGAYTVTLSADGGLANGVDSEIQDWMTALSGSGGGVYDMSKHSLTYAKYCNGKTDSITLSLSHTYSSALTFGSLIAPNSICHTTIFYAGITSNHGIIPS